MEDACSSDALEIWSMVLVTFWAPSTLSNRVWAVSSAILVPFSTARMELSISAAVFLDASADLLARLRTSSATTAKPFPASPARAASTAALSASMLVWKAISSIVLIIFPISLEEELISFIASIMVCICWLLSVIFSPTSSASLLTLCAFSALDFTWLEISLIVAASSSTEEACSVAPWERAWEPDATWSLPDATWSADWLICPNTDESLSMI